MQPPPDTLCIKCSQHQATITNRKESICDGCYNRFIRGKLRKSLSSDVYKANSKYGHHKILVSYSGSKSSIACLDMLYDLILEHQKNFGKSGFDLVVVNIDEFDNNCLDETMMSNFARLRAKYNVEFKVVPLDDYLVGKKLVDFGIDKQFNVLINASDKLSLDDILKIDKSSKEDLIDILYEAILLELAAKENCGTIVYCDTMNKVASDSLSLIIKGRGTKIPNKINDTTINGIKILHPIKELFMKEIDYYNNINDLQQFVVTSNVVISNINKNMTVKQIVDRYLRNVEDNGYSSTIPTVVKISEKLIPPSKFHDAKTCKICGDSIYQDSKSWLSKITVNEPAELVTDEEKLNYQMYMDQVHHENKKISDVDVCYGCMINMSKPITWPTDEDIINEYSLE